MGQKEIAIKAVYDKNPLVKFVSIPKFLNANPQLLYCNSNTECVFIYHQMSRPASRGPIPPCTSGRPI